MNYVYDVLVNLNEYMYDFYDWEESDNFSHVRRTPIFRVSESVFLDFFAKNIKLSEECLININDKTQVFSSRNIELIPYAAIFSDGKKALMIEFNESGIVKKRSRFLINEELEIIEIVKNLKMSNVCYEVINEKVCFNKMIRSEKKIIEDILNELKFLKSDSERIGYLYYEWFEKEGDNDENKYNKLVENIKSKFTSRHEEFLELLNLLTIKK